MDWFADAAGYDVYQGMLTSLPPGNYEFTCTCTTDPAKIPFDDFLGPGGSDYQYGNWVGDYDIVDCPALASSFTNGHIIIAASAPNDACADPGAVVVNGSPNPGTVNAVNNTCTSDGKAWFKYVVNNGEIVNISVAQGAGTLANPEIYQVLLNPVSAPVVCGGANLLANLPLECLQTGDILYIEAGQEDADAGADICPAFGTFNLIISDTDNGVVNDVCADATVLPELTCINNPTGAGNPLACPDPASTVCGSDILPGVWYRFDVASSVVSFDITGTLFEVFTNTSASCVGLTSVGCDNVVNQTNNTLTYYVLVFDGGTFSVTSDFSPPANDDCSTAAVLAGPLTNQSNICANGETIADCPAQDENVVWYTFTMPANMENALITVTPVGPLPIATIAINVLGGSCAGFTGPDGFTCSSNNLSLTCLLPGETYFAQVGSAEANAGNFNINIAFSDNGVPNDQCTSASNINFPNNCQFTTVTGTTLNACAELFTGSGCALDNFPTVWYQAVVPAGGIGFVFRNFVGNPNINILDNNCVTPSQFGNCITAPTEVNNLAPGTYLIAVRNTDPGASFSFEIKTLVRPANDLCFGPANLFDNVPLNGTTACATPFAAPYCGLTGTSHTVFYEYTVPTGNTTNTRLEFTITPNTATTGTAATDLNIGLFTDCGGTTYTPSVVSGDPCNPGAGTFIIECVAPGTVLIIAVGSNDTNEGDFSINVNETNVGVPQNDLCAFATPINFTDECVFTPVNGTTIDACPELFTGSSCNLNNFPTVWYQAVIPANGVGFGFRNLVGNPNINIFNNNCTSLIALSGCINTTSDILTLSQGSYLIAVRNNDPGAPFSFEIKTIVPPSNDLCTNALALSDNVVINGTTSCATPSDDSFCGLNTTNSHTVFYSYTVPAGNTTNTNLEFTITPNTATSGIAATDLNIGLYTDCNGTVYNATVATGDLCNPVGGNVVVECVAPGTVITIAIGSQNTSEGDFSIRINETNAAVPTNDLCLAPNVINIINDCSFQAVNGTTLNACPETFTGGACDLDDFPTVWYEVVLPATGIGFGFENLSPGLNIAIFNDGCPAPGQIGACVTTDIEITTGFTPGTYLIAVRNTDPGAAFSFDIKTILFLANDNPCEGGFISTVLTNNTALPNQNNRCASDDNDCGAGPIENSLWYSFTLPAGFDRITINVTGLTAPSIGIYEEANPCNQVPVNEECNGDGMVEFNCLQEGTTYSIMVGTSAANAGTFTITATQGNNAGPANDFCFNATPINIGPADLCVQLPFTSSNINACPENLPNGSIIAPCNFNTEETSWYIFTAPGQPGDMPNMDFSFTGYTGTGTPFMNLFNFNANCSALTPVENQCFQGLNTTFPNIGPLTPGQQYLIGISSIGDTGGNFNFNVKFNVGPPNDDKCHTASGYNLGSNGSISIANGVQVTNNCSGPDYTVPGCAAVDSENSVWFTFRVLASSSGIEVEITTPGGSADPLTGNIAAAVYEEPCNGSPLLGQACFPVNSTTRLDCLPGGLLSLQISTSALNAGDFNIRINQVTGAGMCNGQPILNDICNLAEVINMAGMLCTPISVSGCNNNACPELFDISSCGYSTNPTVWYQFTVDPDVSSVDIRNMTNGFIYAILNNSPCTDDPVTALNNLSCQEGNTNNIPVNGGQTYYMLVSEPDLGGNFSFNIIQNAFPVNDNPDPAGPFPPFVLGLGDSHGSTTCCALGFNDENAAGEPLDVRNVQCAGSTHDGAVWYRYTTGSEIGFEINVVPSGANPISGPMTVEVLSGSTTNPGNALFTPTSYSCGQAPATLLVGCFDPGEEVWIKVASANADCGSFTLTISEIDQCPLAEECPDIQNVIATNPTDPNCGDFTPVSVQGCLEAACPETAINVCGAGMLPTVWFQVTVDENAVQLGSSIVSNGSWQPVWSIHYGDCGNLTAASGGPPGMQVTCSNEDANPDIHTVGTIAGFLTYYIAVSGQGVIDDPTFTLNVWSSALCVKCIGDDGCDPAATWTVTSRSSDRTLDDPKFCQGEEVRVCINFAYDARLTGADWLHGLIPDFGPGWDMTSFDPSNVTVSPGAPQWIDENDGACAPYITEQMPYLCTYNDPITGRLKLCHTGCQLCPCSGPLLQGSPLPGGWFWNLNGGSGCLNNCNPATHYGIGTNFVPNLNFCVNLKVRTFSSQDECIENRSLQFNFQTTSDGVTGCWEDFVAECKLDFAQVGPKWEVDCSQPPKVLGQDKELCIEGFTDLVLTNADGDNNVVINVEVQDNPNVSGENNYIFNGFGTINDFLVNNSSSVQVVTYIAQSQLPGFLCDSPKDTFEVTLYPKLFVNFAPVSVCEGNPSGTTLTPVVSGGSGVYTGTSVPFVPGYNWSSGQITPTITVFDNTSRTYTVTVTDNKGCSGTAEVLVEVRPKVTFDLSPEIITACSGIRTFTVSNVVSNGNHTTTWNIIPGGLASVANNDVLTVDVTASSPAGSPYLIETIVTDEFGCVGKDTSTLIISTPPFGFVNYVALPGCGETLVDLFIDGHVNLSSTSTFYLLDCTNNQLLGSTGQGPNGEYVLFDDTGIFEDVDLTVTNCFKVLIQSANGCSYITAPLVVPLTTGTDVILTPDQEICKGESAEINVLNVLDFQGGTLDWFPEGFGTLFTVTPTETTQYTVSATQANGCTSIASVTITVNDVPKPGITGALGYCAGQSTNLTATGGSFYTWQGPGFTSNMASTGPINVDGTYRVTVTDINGCTASTSATISQSSVLSIQIAPISICDNTAALLDAGVGFTTYEWRDAANTVIGNTQTISVTQPGTYSVSVTQGSCSGSGTVEVTNFVTPTINIPEYTEVCRLNTGIGPVNFNFVAVADTVTGQWFNIDDAAVNTTDWSNVNFTTITAADTFRFVYITNTATLPCINVRDTLNVIVRNCACPMPGLIGIPDVCNSSTQLINLNAAFTSFNRPSGAWTFIAPSPTPFPTITNDSMLSVANIAEGVYNLRYTYNPATPGNCPKFVERTIAVYNASRVVVRDTVLCNQNIGAGPTSINLNDLIVSVNEPTPGTWTQISGDIPGGVRPIIDVTGMAVDTLVFEYTTTASGVCPPVKALVKVRIRNCDCPEVTLNNDLLCNGSSQLLDLQGPTNFSSFPANIAGTWTVQTPLLISNVKFIDPSGKTPGTYQATFTLTGSVPPGCQSTFTKNIVVVDQPRAQKLMDGSVCSVQTGNGVTELNLYSLLNNGYSSGGVWTQVSPALPQISIAVSGLVEFAGTTPGTNFTFRYSKSAQAPCTNAIVDVVVNVKDCNCPDTEINCVGCDLCNDNDILDLAGTIFNPATIGNGTWKVTGPGNVNIPLNGTILDAMGLPAGPYKATYTLSPAPGGNCPKFDEFPFNIRNKATAIVKPDTLVCNGTTGIQSFSLDSLFISGAFGNWEDEDGVAVTAMDNVISLAGLPNGTVLNFSYVVSNVAPCTTSRYPIKINVTDNCNCENIVLGNIPAICSNVGTLDLKAYNDPKPGTWTASNPLLVINNGILTLTGVPAGTYTLRYTLTNPVVGCPTSATKMITIGNPKTAGTARGAQFCVGDPGIVLMLNDFIEGEDSGGTWSVISGGSAGFNAMDGSFDRAGRPAGTYVFRYSFDNQTVCQDDSEDVTIKINPLPVADAGVDKTINCDVQFTVLGTDLSSTGTNIVYEWKLGGQVIASTLKYTANVGGIYTLTVMDTLSKCSTQDVVTVVQDDDLPIFDIRVDTIACFGQTATITLSNIRGGKSPYQISFNGGTTYGSALIASSLKTGTYKVLVKDANGCVNDQWPAITITEPPLFTVNLGEDFFLNIGEDSLLTIKGQYNEATAQTVTWKANTVEIASAKNKPELAVSPEEDTDYNVTVINQSGCIASDNLRISIRRVKPECVPNIFTPHNQGENNYFSINCAEVDKVTKYSIYDRWGNLLFTGKDLLPSQPQSFWDGRFKGKEVVPGVYVFYLELLFKDGSTEKRSGDVTVLR
ncbi:MAG: gliding motility-associated C-terminal domain-containing protein [Saprospiraceae bacterium]|nr:gliding motility-associated C-terminal domain-containing protein [Saprospiraceae bacterium]